MTQLTARRMGLLTDALDSAGRRLDDAGAPKISGHLVKVSGITLEAAGCAAPVGARCLIDRGKEEPLEAEVAGFSGDRLLLTPLGDLHGISPRARVTPMGEAAQFPVGPALLGRVIDGTGEPIDGKGSLKSARRVSISPPRRNPLDRQPIAHPLDVGVRSLNALLTVGRGQRLGLFAGSGVGKSMLLGMMTRFTAADVVVVALIGERAREVQEFIHSTLGPTGMAKATVVVAPADAPPALRLRAASLATAIAEDFRANGRQVLLLMDSLTRVAQAQREIGLAVGEPPTAKGYPPSVFATLPALIERAGTDVAGGGTITAFYTVLTEGDPLTDPIADAARAILDGHVQLSRTLAEAGHFPAIDIEASVSRVAIAVSEQRHLEATRAFRRVLAVYAQHRDLIDVGAYSAGTKPEVDQAVRLYPQLMSYLRQDLSEQVSLPQSINALQELVAELLPDISAAPSAPLP